MLTALLDAAPRGRHPCIADRNKRGLTPLGEAVAAGRADIAKSLVTKVALLSFAWSACHVHVVTHLLICWVVAL